MSRSVGSISSRLLFLPFVASRDSALAGGCVIQAGWIKSKSISDKRRHQCESRSAESARLRIYLSAVVVSLNCEMLNFDVWLLEKDGPASCQAFSLRGVLSLLVVDGRT